MTTLVSTGAPVRFVPPDQAGKPEREQTAYYVKPAGVFEKPLYRRICAERAGSFPTDETMFATVRRGLESSGREDLLAVVDDYEPVYREFEEALREARALATPEEREERVRGHEVPPDLAAAMEDVESLLMGGFEPYRLYHARRVYYMEVAAIVSFQLLCTGWDNGAVDFKRNQNGIPSDVMDKLPAGHVEYAGDRAIGLMTLSGEEEKNSDSPSPGASTEATSSTAKDGPRKTPRPRGKAGASRKSAGKS